MSVVQLANVVLREPIICAFGEESDLGRLSLCPGCREADGRGLGEFRGQAALTSIALRPRSHASIHRPCAAPARPPAGHGGGEQCRSGPWGGGRAERKAGGRCGPISDGTIAGEGCATWSKRHPCRKLWQTHPAAPSAHRLVYELWGVGVLKV